ncbi:MAG TPA: M23 family metallopeptidase [Sediminispirochaeta sp.]|nr:M23 family metallopeptidase [Sediminispirochaeta sp.]
MSQKQVPRLLWLLILLPWTLSSVHGQHELEPTVPGGLVLLEQLRGAGSIELIDPLDGVSSRSRSFPWEGQWVGLVAVPAESVPGDYRIVVNYDDSIEGDGFRLNVEQREFRLERIRLDHKLTELRDSEDPQKREESLEIQQIYAGFNQDSGYAMPNFQWPIETEQIDYARVSAHYGDRRVYIYSDGREIRSFHSGIDLAVRGGTPVVAPAAGRVVMAQDRIISGQTLVIEHLPGLYSVYFHLRKLLVRQGAEVERGQQLGLVGMTGLATGPHLHWEVRVNSIPVDPGILTEGDFPDKINAAAGVGN